MVGTEANQALCSNKNLGNWVFKQVYVSKDELNFGSTCSLQLSEMDCKRDLSRVHMSSDKVRVPRKGVKYSVVT